MADVLESSALACWRANPLSFIEQVLRDPETGQPFDLFDAQREFLTGAFTLTDDGRLAYPEQVFGAIKKSGKSATAAMHLLTMTLVHGGRFAEGLCGSNDFEQAQGRVFQAARRIVECSPYLKREAQTRRTASFFPRLAPSSLRSRPTMPVRPGPIRWCRRSMNCGPSFPSALAGFGTKSYPRQRARLLAV